MRTTSERFSKGEVSQLIPCVNLRMTRASEARTPRMTHGDGIFGVALEVLHERSARRATRYSDVCVASKTAALEDGLRPTNFSGTREKSLYEMAVSNEATRLRKGDPALSQKEAMARATTTISPADYGETETPQEQKARKLKEAQKEFAADLEKSMAR